MGRFLRRKCQNTGFRVAGLGFAVIFCDETVTGAVATREHQGSRVQTEGGIRYGKRIKRLRDKMGVQGLRAGGTRREQ